MIAYFVMTGILFFAARSDVKNRAVGNIYPLLVLAVSAAAVTFKCLSDRETALTALLFAIAGAGAGFLLTAIPAVKGEIGGADVKILTAAGLGLGIPDIFWLMLLSFLIALAGAAFVIVRNKIRRQEKADLKLRIPLLPSICAGTAIFTVLKLVEYIRSPVN
jgi:Flp pilus assembly protein protease CpaA